MMDLSPVRMLRLPPGEFVVIGSAIMEIKGIRKAHDIDVLVSPNVWKSFSGTYPKGPHGQIVNGAIEIWSDDLPGISFREVLESAEMIEDIPFMGLERLLRWKRERGWEKDEQDVALIEEYLGKTQEDA